MATVINVVVKGMIDEFVARRLIEFVGFSAGSIYGGNGKPHLLRLLEKQNQASRFMPCLCLIDMDTDAECPADYVQLLRTRHLKTPQSPGFLLRISVRQVEAWLLGDRDHFATFFKVTPNKIPLNPETINDGKSFIVRLMRESNKSPWRELLLPIGDSRHRIGPGYSTVIKKFLYSKETPWRPDVAAEHSPSLARCLRALRRLSPG